MMRSVACTAAVAAAVAVLTGAATATANDVAASAKQYGHSSCYQQKYKCGEDYSKCTYEYGVCVQFGCHKDVSYSCPYEAREKYDCLKKVDETYTVTERKSYQDTQWVKGGCEKDGKIKYDCNKTYDEACKKQREVSFRCTKTRTVDCQKEKDATCTRRKYKQCFHPSKTEVWTAAGGNGSLAGWRVSLVPRSPSTLRVSLPRWGGLCVWAPRGWGVAGVPPRARVSVRPCPLATAACVGVRPVGGAGGCRARGPRCGVALLFFFFAPFATHARCGGRSRVRRRGRHRRDSAPRRHHHPSRGRGGRRSPPGSPLVPPSPVR